MAAAEEGTTVAVLAVVTLEPAPEVGVAVVRQMFEGAAIALKIV